jgi:hypothetical protein
MGRSSGLRRRVAGAPTSPKSLAVRSNSSAGFTPASRTSQSDRWTSKALRSASGIPVSGVARPPARAVQKVSLAWTASSKASGRKWATTTRYLEEIR